MIAPPTPPSKGSNKLLTTLQLLSSSAYNNLEISLSRTRLAAGASIFDQDIDRVLFIQHGIASPIITTREGDPLGIAMIGSEGAVGLPGMGDIDYGFQVRAQTAIEALQISARALRMACSGSRELENLLRNYSDVLFRESIRTMVCHYHHDLDKRLPRWLLMATERMGANRLLITQEILAEAHGVTPSAVSLVLEALEETGLVQRARGQITVLNRRRLNTEACRCYSLIDREKNISSNHTSFRGRDRF